MKTIILILWISIFSDAYFNHIIESNENSIKELEIYNSEILEARNAIKQYPKEKDIVKKEYYSNIICQYYIKEQNKFSNIEMGELKECFD